MSSGKTTTRESYGEKVDKALSDAAIEVKRLKAAKAVRRSSRAAKKSQSSRPTTDQSSSGVAPSGRASKKSQISRRTSQASTAPLSSAAAAVTRTAEESQSSRRTSEQSSASASGVAASSRASKKIQTSRKKIDPSSTPTSGVDASSRAAKKSQSSRRSSHPSSAPLSGVAASEDLKHRAQHLHSDGNLDLIGVSVHWLQNGLMEDVKAAGLDRSATIYEIEADVILKKGKDLLSPCDGKRGTSYVHALLTTNEKMMVKGKRVCPVGPSKFMLSYGWGYKIGDIADTLLDYCITNKLDPAETYVWMCCLCINQHRVAEQKANGGTGMLNFEEEFPVKITKIGHMLAMMAPWQKPLYLSRIWCVFELYTAARLPDCKLSILMPPQEKEGLKRTLFESEEEIVDEIDEGIKPLFEALSNTNVQEAQASIESDKVSILKTIEQNEGCVTINQKVNNLLRDWVFSVVSSFGEEWNNKPNWFESAEAARKFLKIGHMFQHFDHYDAAHDEYKKALAIRSSLLGRDHPDTAVCHSSIGAVLEAMGNFDGALKAHKKALDIREAKLGSNHPDIAESYRRIGEVCNSMGHHSLALKYHDKALEVGESAYGANHKFAATVHGNIGMSYYQKGEPDEALIHTNKGIAIEEAVLGTNHPSTAISYNNLGMILRSKGDYKGALVEYRKALSISESVMGENHSDAAVAHNNIGALLHFQGDYAGALESYRKALAIFQVVHGEMHPMVATSRNNIGFILHLMKEYDAAIEEYKKAWDIREEVLGKYHKKTQDTGAMIDQAMKAKWQDISDHNN